MSRTQTQQMNFLSINIEDSLSLNYLFIDNALSKKDKTEGL